MIQWERVMPIARRHRELQIETCNEAAEPAELLCAADYPAGSVLLESGGPRGPLARWSFLALDPIASLQAFPGDPPPGNAPNPRLARVELRAGTNGKLLAAGDADPLEVLAACTRALTPGSSPPPPAAPGAPGVSTAFYPPPFTAGAVVSLAHELVRFLEPEQPWRAPATPASPTAATAHLLRSPGWPWISARFFGAVLAHDRLRGRTFIAEALPNAADPLRELALRVRRPSTASQATTLPPPTAPSSSAAPPTPAAPGDPHLPPWVEASLSPAAHRAAVDQIQARIRAGDTYETNLTLQLTTTPPPASAAQLHQTLRRLSPAAFSAFADLPGFTAISSSPELFLRLRGDRIETRPIKGTRPRGTTPAADRRQLHELLTSPKERAENLMICDLARNDLGRVAATGSVAVSRLCRPQRLPAVFHLVSAVTARTRRAVTTPELLRATFPPGSMTGAPKLRTCRIIEHLEPVPRGPYAGALGYWNHNQDLDLAVVIRTLIQTARRLHLGVGGAITADSDPDSEYAECLAKARLPLLAVEQCRNQQRG